MPSRHGSLLGDLLTPLCRERLRAGLAPLACPKFAKGYGGGILLARCRNRIGRNLARGNLHRVESALVGVAWSLS